MQTIDKNTYASTKKCDGITRCIDIAISDGLWKLEELKTKKIIQIFEIIGNQLKSVIEFMTKCIAKSPCIVY